MKNLILFSLLTLSSAQVFAFATNGYGSTILGTSKFDGYGSHISAEHHKVIMAAKNAEQDLYYFQASNGEVVTANLLNAIAIVQEVHAELNDQQAIEALFGAL